jgi:Response regulator receiver domain
MVATLIFISRPWRRHFGPASSSPRSDRIETDAELSQVSEAGRLETILIVDDDRDVRTMMASLLSEIGYLVHEAEDGEAARPMQKAVNPQLVIIDFAIPGINVSKAVFVLLSVTTCSSVDGRFHDQNLIGPAARLRSPIGV